jgi:SagB-type dehydrogenase family enzyme
VLGARCDWTLSTLGVLLQSALGITAWKSYGPDRWAVRANPSSGNLHPVEAYVIAQQLPFLADGVYHYDPEHHTLALRAHWPAQAAPSPARALHIALTSLMWREAWKYGERAFRYCQLDVGHASAAIAIASRLLGCEVAAETSVGHAQLAQLLGLDREQDYPQTRAPLCEREEPELVLQIELAAETTRQPTWPNAATLAFHGQASVIDPRPMYRWPIIAEVANATRSAPKPPVTVARGPSAQRQPAPAVAPSAHSVLLGRRSAQRFDPTYEMPLETLCALLGPLMPSHAGPWRALANEPAPAIDLVLFIHRVAQLEPGLYVLPRRGRDSAAFLERLAQQGPLAPLALPDPELPLLRVCTTEPRQLMRVARTLHCHQDIAATSAFAVGMIAEFAPRLRRDPADYRELYREAGLIGQLLYVHAEAYAVRGTGIGCYFDDAVHEVLGLRDAEYQSLYHFTVGRAIDDARLETGAAYPGRDA